MGTIARKKRCRLEREFRRYQSEFVMPRYNAGAITRDGFTKSSISILLVAQPRGVRTRQDFDSGAFDDVPAIVLLYPERDRLAVKSKVVSRFW